MLVWNPLPTCSHFFNKTGGRGVLEVIHASLQQTFRIRHGRCWSAHTTSCCSATAFDISRWTSRPAFFITGLALTFLKAVLSRFYVAVVSFRQAFISFNQASSYSRLATLLVPPFLDSPSSSLLSFLGVGPSFNAWPPYVPVGVPSFAPFSYGTWLYN
jgi:hypothetical protein